MSTIKSFRFVSLGIIILLFSLVPVSASEYLVIDEAVDDVNEARIRFVDAYFAVLNAEKAGANGSVLVNRLNDAQVLLVNANVSLSKEDYGNATLLADQCIALSSQIIKEAVDLQASAESQKANSLVWTFSLTIMSLLLLCVFGLFGWKLLKKRYVKRVLGMKPTAVNNA